MPSLWDLRIGDVLDLRSGVMASVMMPTEDGEWILVKYLSFGTRLELAGQTDLVTAEEIAGVFVAATC